MHFTLEITVHLKNSMHFTTIASFLKNMLTKLDKHLPSISCSSFPGFISQGLKAISVEQTMLGTILWLGSARSGAARLE